MDEEEVVAAFQRRRRPRPRDRRLPRHLHHRRHRRTLRVQDRPPRQPDRPLEGQAGGRRDGPSGRLRLSPTLPSQRRQKVHHSGHGGCCLFGNNIINHIAQ